MSTVVRLSRNVKESCRLKGHKHLPHRFRYGTKRASKVSKPGTSTQSSSCLCSAYVGLVALVEAVLFRDEVYIYGTKSASKMSKSGTSAQPQGWLGFACAILVA